MIAQSGSAINSDMPSLRESERSGEKFGAKLRSPGRNNVIKFLRRLPPENLIKGASDRAPHEPPSMGVPVIDGWVIPRPPLEVFAEGQESPIPMIVGTTSREFSSSLPLDELRKWIENFSGSLAPRALSLYGLSDNGGGISDPMYGTAADQWFVDILRCSVVAQAIFHNAAHHHVYEYELQHASPGQEGQGAVHSADLPYVFGFYSGNASGNFTETDYKLGNLMESYWTTFARTGSPNDASLPNWPEFRDSESYIAFTQDGRVASISGGLRRPQCELLREAMMQRMAGQN